MAGGIISGMRGLISGVSGGKSKITDPPRPDIPLAVIGDIHGCIDLLDKMLLKISRKAPQARLIFVGDYVDRGPQSRSVLDRVRHPELGAICLKGNHEVMLGDFLDDPLENGRRWLRHGGTETLESFGISLDDTSSAQEVLEAAAGLSDALGDGSYDWLTALPLYWQSGNVVVAHAGADPALPIQSQPEDNFLWGHSRFLRDDRLDGRWVVHGHWAGDRPTVSNRRINVDTGAYRNGRLSAVLLDPQGDVQFVSVT